MRKNNITLTSKNIISFFRNITSHFTGKEKIITLVSLIIMLSFSNITLCSSNIFNSSNASALSYQSNVGLSFTFNPTLSVNISLSDLVISNLTPGTTSDSNIINVSVASNASYGYTLSAIVNGNNNNLTHTNGTNTFSSIATDSSLPNLVTDNTWGYSYKLSNDTNWNNYSGLSNETSKTLVDSNDQTAIPIDFKIGAKAASTQASGTYTGVINFTAVTKHIPVTLAEAYASEGKTMTNGFYTMQDMTSTICSKVEAIGAQLQVLDRRDNKLYWISKLADNHCWMTQNLDFDIQKNEQEAVALTSELTDLVDGSLSGAYMNGYAYAPDPNNPDTSGVYNGLITWTPHNSTNTAYTLTNPNGWENNNTEPYSYDNGEFYPDSLVNKQSFGEHASSGNYYNWSAAVASNSSYSTSDTDRNNSVCPKSWRLPKKGEHTALYNEYKNDSNTTAFGLMKLPLLYVRAGLVTNKSGVGYAGGYGCYWSGTSSSQNYSYYLNFSASYVSSDRNIGDLKSYGFTVRCLAR